MRAFGSYFCCLLRILYFGLRCENLLVLSQLRQLRGSIQFLVGGFNPPEKYEFVSWDDEIPNIWKNHPFMFQSPPTSYQLLCFGRQKMGSPDFNHHLAIVFQGRPLPCFEFAQNQQSNWISIQNSCFADTVIILTSPEGQDPFFVDNRIR